MALEVGGNPTGLVNKVAVGILAVILGTTLLGTVIDYCVVRYKVDVHRAKLLPRGWVLGMLASSYAILIPGIFLPLFSLQIGALDSLSLQHSTDSMISFTNLLIDTGSHIGGAFVIIFAMVIPALKLCLLLFGVASKMKALQRLGSYSRTAILFVQVISKWACPDMFAYILMQYLVRSLNHPPKLNGIMNLDIGFSCFSLFCLSSTVSSLGICIPPTSSEPKQNKAAFYASKVGYVTGLVFLTFAVLLVIGVIVPSMSLRLDIDVLYENGTIPIEAKPFVDTLNLSELARADVSIWQCSAKLLENISDEFNSILAFILLAIFVLVLTVLDMVFLLAAGIQAQLDLQNKVVRRNWWKDQSSILRKLSMLDVFLVGVIVVVLSGSIYKEDGLVLNICPGWWVLFGAEVLHYATFFLVSTAIKEPNQPMQKEELQYGVEHDSDVSTETCEISNDNSVC